MERRHDHRGLERHVVMRGQVPLLVLLGACGLTGCFDVDAINLHVIDNFNNGDLQPVDPVFTPWDYKLNATVASPNNVFGLDTDTEDGSAGALLLDVTVIDMPDGLQDHGGAAAFTSSGMGPVDFTGHVAIAFDIKMQSGGENPLPAAALIYLELGCSKVPAQSGDLHDLYVSQGVPYSSTWHNVAVTFDNFGPPPWLVEPIRGGTVACLQHVDAVRFAIDAQLPDGKTGEAILHIDNVVLE